MSVLVLNTLPESDACVSELQNQICAKAEGSEVIYTKDMKLSHCIGCNYCWLKTPGICTIKDDYEIILKKILQHEKIVFITDTKFGFVSYRTKNLLDRILPIATMYLQFVDGQQLLTEDAASVYLQDGAKLVAVNKKFTNFLFYPVYVLDLAAIKPRP